ncbi:uncharacterized protein K02A2.6-like [Ochlerotatus camptorhynchus]|uniref:uncharacterized protein K02A2.6-like n=1 Tax=Ochlerotatus camptorhynchus TaxID=644619 RepID=UPI0031D2863F
MDGEYYLIVVDAHSKWPEIFPTRQITAKATISLLRSLFSNKGMPEVLVTDNGTQFKSAEFSQFCNESGIRHLNTVPFHPQSNSQAERFVDTFKRAVKKIQEEEGTIKHALDICLLTYRTTPNPNVPDGKSPAEVMYNRPLQTSLDLIRAPQHLEPETRQANSNQPRSFHPKDSVYAKVYGNNKWTWAPGIVVEKFGSVMYNIWVNNKKMIRSHINQLRARTMTGTGNVEQQPSRPLPISILLSEWKLPSPTPVPTVPLPEDENPAPSTSTMDEDRGDGMLSISPNLQIDLPLQ